MLLPKNNVWIHLRPDPHKGQALILLLLVLSVVLVVSLSIASRSVTDISTVTYEEESLRAFSAAEAGIEELLNRGAPSVGVPVNSTPADFSASNASFTAVPEYIIPGDVYEYPSYLLPGETAVFWFVGHDANNELTCNSSYAPSGCFTGNKIKSVCWGIYPDSDYESNKSDWPALEISIYYDENVPAAVTSHDYSGIRVIRKTFDPNNSRSGSNEFDSGGMNPNRHCPFEDTDYKFTITEASGKLSFSGLGVPNFNQEGSILAVTIKMLYHDPKKPEKIALSSDSDLPPQGISISSSGSVGETTRKLEVLKTYAVPPSIFESALFSYGSIMK